MRGVVTLRREAPLCPAEIAPGLPDGEELARQGPECVLRACSADLDEPPGMPGDDGNTEPEEIVRTIAETLLEQGEARGLAKGVARGLAKGVALGKAKTLLRQAGIRFGDVPADRVDEIQAADVATLDRWLDAVFVAETLEDVFEPRKSR